MPDAYGRLTKSAVFWQVEGGERESRNALYDSDQR